MSPMCAMSSRLAYFVPYAVVLLHRRPRVRNDRPSIPFRAVFPVGAELVAEADRLGFPLPVGTRFRELLERPLSSRESLVGDRVRLRRLRAALSWFCDRRGIARVHGGRLGSGRFGRRGGRLPARSWLSGREDLRCGNPPFLEWQEFIFLDKRPAFLYYSIEKRTKLVIGFRFA